MEPITPEEKKSCLWFLLIGFAVLFAALVVAWIYWWWLTSGRACGVPPGSCWP